MENIHNKSSLKEETRQDVLDLLDRFISMQAEHLKMFTKGDLSKLFTGGRERQVISCRIKDNLAFIAGVSFEGSAEFHTLLNRKIEKIRYVDELLTVEVAKQRDCTKQQMMKIRKGRKVLSGYSLKSEVSSPRFVSNRS